MSNDRKILIVSMWVAVAALLGFSFASCDGVSSVPDEPASHSTPSVGTDSRRAPSELASDILRWTNEARSAGHTCQAYPGNIPFAQVRAYPREATRLVLDAQLTANAQAHALHVAETVDLGMLLQEHHQTTAAIAAAGGSSENVGSVGPITTTASDGSQTIRPEPEDEVGRRLVNAWLASPGHCHNLMQPQWNRIGIGVALSPGERHYGVQVFGR